MGYISPSFTLRVTSDEEELPPGGNIEFEAGVLLTFEFNITAGYDTQYLQVQYV